MLLRVGHGCCEDSDALANACSYVLGMGAIGSRMFSQIDVVMVCTKCVHLRLDNQAEGQTLNPKPQALYPTDPIFVLPRIHGCQASAQIDSWTCGFFSCCLAPAVAPASCTGRFPSISCSIKLRI